MGGGEHSPRGCSSTRLRAGSLKSRRSSASLSLPPPSTAHQSHASRRRTFPSNTLLPPATCSLSSSSEPLPEVAAAEAVTNFDERSKRVSASPSSDFLDIFCERDIPR